MIFSESKWSGITDPVMEFFSDFLRTSASGKACPCQLAGETAGAQNSNTMIRVTRIDLNYSEKAYSDIWQCATKLGGIFDCDAFEYLKRCLIAGPSTAILGLGLPVLARTSFMLYRFGINKRPCQKSHPGEEKTQNRQLEKSCSYWMRTQSEMRSINLPMSEIVFHS
jgi:hypothetical protein